MKKQDNDLSKVQKIILNQLERLDDNKLMQVNGNEEIKRGDVISRNAKSFVQLVNAKIKIGEFAERTGKTIDDASKELGV